MTIILGGITLTLNRGKLNVISYEAMLRLHLVAPAGAPAVTTAEVEIN